MSGTIAAAAKAQLFGTGNVLTAVLAGFTGTDAVTVAYDMPRDVSRRLVVGGRVGGSVQLAAMRGGGRTRREENLSIALHVRVYEPGHKTTETTDADAIAISALIEDYIAANPTLGGLTNLILASLEAVDLEGFLDDDGATSVLTLTIGLKSYLA